MLRPYLPAIVFLILGGAVGVAFGALDAVLEPVLPELGERGAEGEDA